MKRPLLMNQVTAFLQVTVGLKALRLLSKHALRLLRKARMTTGPRTTTQIGPSGNSDQHLFRGWRVTRPSRKWYRSWSLEDDQEGADLERRIDDEEDHHEKFRFARVELWAKQACTMVRMLGEARLCNMGNNKIVWVNWYCFLLLPLTYGATEWSSINTHFGSMQQEIYSHLEVMQPTMNDNAFRCFQVSARYFEFAFLELEVCASQNRNLFYSIWPLAWCRAHQSKQFFFQLLFLLSGKMRQGHAAGIIHWCFANRTHNHHGLPNCTGN
jgi:hypothetical protein